MVVIDNTNIIDFICDYCKKFCNVGQMKDLLVRKYRVSEACLIKLTETGVLKDKRSTNSASKESHIAITGDRRVFWYSEETIANAKESSGDDRQPVIVFMNNIDDLESRDYDDSYDKKNSFDLKEIESHTMKKICYRKSSNSVQVQLSKIRLDGYDFLELRKQLRVNDLLVFFKSSKMNTVIVFGVPFEFYHDKYSLCDMHVHELYTGNNSTSGEKVRNEAKYISAVANVNMACFALDSLYQQIVNKFDGGDDTAKKNYRTIMRPVPRRKLFENSEEKYEEDDGFYYPLDPEHGVQVLRENNYRCMFDDHSYTDFFVDANGNNYAEVQFVIPFAFQNSFNGIRLDMPYNLVCCCPRHKRMLLYAKDDVKKNMVKRMFDLKKNELLNAGIAISIGDLLEMYGVT